MTETAHVHPLNRLYRRLHLREGPGNRGVRGFSWGGCPRFGDSCLHRQWDGESVKLCPACTKAKVRHAKWLARLEKQDRHKKET
jgi:hypothetical protein